MTPRGRGTADLEDRWHSSEARVLKFPLVLRFPVLTKNLRFLPLIIKVICLELKIQGMEKV